MISNIKNQYNTNFCAIQLSEKEAKIAASHLSELFDINAAYIKKQALKNDLFNIFNKHLKREAAIKTNKFYIFKDVLSEIYLKFSEQLNDIKNYHSLDIFINKLNEYKPSKNTVKSEYIHSSLDADIYTDNSLLKRLDRITSEDLPSPKSAEYLDSVKARINKIIEKRKLSPIVKERIKARLNGIKYKDIAQKGNINIDVAKRSVQKGVLRLQYENGVISKNYIEKAKAIAPVFNCDTETAVKIMLKNPAVVSDKPETIMQNIRDIAKLFNCSEEKIIKISVKYLDICFQRPETLLNNVRKSAELLGCEQGEFMKVCFRFPPLFYLKPESVLKNVEQACIAFNCKKEDYVRTTLRQPQLFCQKFETLMSNIRRSAANISCSTDKLIQAALIEPAIFCLKPDTIAKNYKKKISYLKCSEKEFIDTALKNPKLLIIRPDTLINNAKQTAKYLGLIEQKFHQIAITKPYLFFQNPESLYKKLKVENYYRKIKNEEPKEYPNKESEQSVYKKIIAFLIQKSKIKETEEFVKTKRNFDLIAFIKAFENKHFVFEIPEDEIADDFIYFIRRISMETIGKNIFEFNIIKDKK